ncbi:MAG: O-antigen ligase family protein [Rickettsiales bacterium]|nr:O-antigen ligase family protein [Rickettsiales bacterium]
MPPKPHTEESVLLQRMHLIAAWSTILIPIACAVSRAAADGLLILVAVLFLVSSAIRRDFSWARESWVALLLILWAYLVARGIFTAEMKSALSRAGAWVRFPVFTAAICFWVLRDPVWFKKLIISLSIAVGFMLIDTGIQYIAGIELLGREPYPGDGSPRLTGPFSSPRIGIMLIWMSIPVLAYWLVSDSGQMRNGRTLAMGVAYTLLLVVIVFITGERMAFLLTGLAFVIAFFLLPIPKKWLLLMGGIAAALVIGMATLNPGLVQRQMKSTEHVVSEFSGSHYGQIWGSAIAMFKAHPIVGVGPKQFRARCPEPAFGPLDQLEIRCNLHPHNMYLEWAVESGMIGLALFAGAFVLLIRRALADFPTLKLQPVYLGLLITLCIRLWPLASTTGFFTAWSAVPFWLVVGWLLAFSYQHGKK